AEANFALNDTLAEVRRQRKDSLEGLPKPTPTPQPEPNPGEPEPPTGDRVPSFMNFWFAEHTKDAKVNGAWNPVLLERALPFDGYRFMDWSRTNGNRVQRWDDRTTESRWTGTGRVSWEDC